MPIDRKLAIAAPLVLMLGACEHNVYEGAHPASNFGDANRMTMMAQVIDPDPHYAEPMQTSAEHAAQAVDRVRKDQVKKPERVRATQGVGGGSGGSGGGGGGN